jgi:IclR family KDG regulon transcriptional repressor
MESKNQFVKGNQSIHHCFDILEMFIQTNEPIHIKNIAERLGMSLSSVHALLRTMIDRGYIAHLAPRQGYVLGPSLINICMTISTENQLVSIAKPIIEQLSADCDNETSYLGYYQNFSVNILILQQSPKLLGLKGSNIESTGLHANSMGKSMLAFMSPREYKKWKEMNLSLKKLTEHTITSFGILEEELTLIREQGYSENNQENEEGVYTMACPIFNNVGKAIACAAIGIPLLRYTEEKKQKFIFEVSKQAEFISGQLGFFDTK